MIAAAVKILQLSCVASAANPDQSLPCSSSDAAASSSAAQDITVNAAPPALAYCQFQGTDPGADIYLDLTSINHSLDKLRAAYEIWYGNIRQGMSAALRDSIDEYFRLTSSGSREEGVKSVCIAFKEKLSKLFTSNETVELLQTFVAGCIGVLRAYSDDCDIILSRKGATTWSKHNNQMVWAQYVKLNDSCFTTEWYTDFKSKLVDYFYKQKSRISKYQDTRKLCDLFKQDVASEAIFALWNRVDMWVVIIREFDLALKGIHSDIIKLAALNEDTLLDGFVERILLHSIDPKSANLPDQYYLED
ncbi:hypothetical protein PAPHI01_1977, partial [Pancytospora philotis]